MYQVQASGDLIGQSVAMIEFAVTEQKVKPEVPIMQPNSQPQRPDSVQRQPAHHVSSVVQKVPQPISTINPQHNLSEQNVAKIQNVIQMAQKMVENMSVGGQANPDAMTNLERYKQKLRS